MEAAEVGFNFSKRFDGGTRKSSKRLAALTASSLRFARGAMFHNSISPGCVRKLRYWRRLFARRFDCGSHVLSALECTSDVVVVGAAVEGEQLQTMRTLHLKAIANPLDPLAKYHRAFRAFDFDLSFDHRCASDGRASYHAKLNCFPQGAKRARSWVPGLTRISDIRLNARLVLQNPAPQSVEVADSHRSIFSVPLASPC